MNSITKITDRIHLPWFTLLIAAMTYILFNQFDPANDALVLHREAIGRGHIYQLITGHFIHSDLSHLLWNLVGLLIIGSTLEVRFKLSARYYLGLLLLAIFTIDLQIWFGEPELRRYCGLSGLLNAQLALLLILAWRQTLHIIFPLIILGVLLKITVEAIIGGALFTQTAWEATPSTHAIGLITGVAVAFIMAFKPTANKP